MNDSETRIIAMVTYVLDQRFFKDIPSLVEDVFGVNQEKYSQIADSLNEFKIIVSEIDRWLKKTEVKDPESCFLLTSRFSSVWRMLEKCVAKAILDNKLPNNTKLSQQLEKKNAEMFTSILRMYLAKCQLELDKSVSKLSQLVYTFEKNRITYRIIQHPMYASEFLEDIKQEIWAGVIKGLPDFDFGRLKPGDGNQFSCIISSLLHPFTTHHHIERAIIKCSGFERFPKKDKDVYKDVLQRFRDALKNEEICNQAIGELSDQQHLLIRKIISEQIDKRTITLTKDVAGKILKQINYSLPIETERKILNKIARTFLVTYNRIVQPPEIKPSPEEKGSSDTLSFEELAYLRDNQVPETLSEEELPENLDRYGGGNREERKRNALQTYKFLNEARPIDVAIDDIKLILKYLDENEFSNLDNVFDLIGKSLEKKMESIRKYEASNLSPEATQKEKLIMNYISDLVVFRAIFNYLKQPPEFLAERLREISALSVSEFYQWTWLQQKLGRGKHVWNQLGTNCSETKVHSFLNDYLKPEVYRYLICDYISEDIHGRQYIQTLRNKIISKDCKPVLEEVRYRNKPSTPSLYDIIERKSYILSANPSGWDEIYQDFYPKVLPEEASNIIYGLFKKRDTKSEVNIVHVFNRLFDWS